MIHAVGDAPAPPLLGGIAGRYGWNTTFFVVAGAMALAGLLWCRRLALELLTLHGVLAPVQR